MAHTHQRIIQTNTPASLGTASTPTPRRSYTFYHLLTFYLCLRRTFYVLCSLSRSHGRVARAAAISLSRSLSSPLHPSCSVALRRTDTATNPPPPPAPRTTSATSFPSVDSHSHAKNDAEVYTAERPNSRANAAGCSSLPGVGDAVERSTHTHTLTYTHERTFLRFVARSLARSVGWSFSSRARVGHTRVVFVSVSSARGGADATRPVARLVLAPRRLATAWTRAGRPRIFARRARHGRKK